MAFSHDVLKLIIVGRCILDCDSQLIRINQDGGSCGPRDATLFRCLTPCVGLRHRDCICAGLHSPNWSIGGGKRLGDRMIDLGTQNPSFSLVLPSFEASGCAATNADQHHADPFSHSSLNSNAPCTGPDNRQQPCTMPCERQTRGPARWQWLLGGLFKLGVLEDILKVGFKFLPIPRRRLREKEDGTLRAIEFCNDHVVRHIHAKQ
jgi:hypothetical protein